jgi:uncharacterized protein
MTSLHLNPAAIAEGDRVIAEMRALAPSMVFASLITEDGFEVTHAPAGSFDNDRLASMSSSVQALSDAVARELAMGESDYVVIATKSSHLLQLRVPGQRVILAALFDDMETLGKALSTARRGVERLAALLAAINSAQPTPSIENENHV